MPTRWPSSRAAVALLLLALLLAPIARAALADTDLHRCCPESAPAAESPMPCQYVAPLGCCAQLGLPVTAASGDSRVTPAAVAFIAFTPFVSLPPVHAFASTRGGHGPPRASLVRTSVLRL